MSTIPNGTRVIVVAENDQKFSGTILASGSQAKVLMYAVLLDNPESYPGIESGVSVVEVPYTQVGLNTQELFGQDFYIDVTKPRITTL